MVIYKTTNTLNGKFYVGKDVRNRPSYLGSGSVLKKAIAKYGKSVFKKEILEYCSSLEQLNEREKYWIECTKALELGYNIAHGGTGGNTGGGGGAPKGSIPWNKGLCLPPSWNKNTKGVMKANKGTFQAGSSHKLYGRKQTQETIQKRKRTRLANGNGYRAPDTGPFARKPLLAVMVGGLILEFCSLREACAHFQLKYNTVRHAVAVNGKGQRELITKTANGAIKFIPKHERADSLL